MGRPPSHLPGDPPPGSTRTLAARRRAVTLAGHRGDEPVARAALDDPDPKVRTLGLSALARMGRLRPADLDAASRDADPVVRRRAAELSTGDRSEDGPRLARLLADDDARVVEAACWAAGEAASGSDDLLVAVQQVATEHDDPLCRESAIAALGAAGDERGLPTILAALGDRATVRRRAIIALAPFDGPEVEGALQRHLTDRDRQVRQAAEDLLALAGPDEDPDEDRAVGDDRDQDDPSR